MGNVYVCYAGDFYTPQRNRVLQAGDVGALRQLDQKYAAAAADVFTAWALGLGGAPVEAGCVEIPAVGLPDLEAARQRYGAAVGGPASCGVAGGVAEAGQALHAAQRRGGDRITAFDAQVAAEAVGDPLPTPPTPPVPPLVKTEAPTPDPTPTGPPPPFDPQMALQAFHAAAGTGETADRVAQAQRSGELAELRQRTATTLDGLRAQLPALQQVRQAYPLAYDAVIKTVQSLVEVGRQLQALDPQASISE